MGVLLEYFFIRNTYPFHSVSVQLMERMTKKSVLVLYLRDPKLGSREAEDSGQSLDV